MRLLPITLRLPGAARRGAEPGGFVAKPVLFALILALAIAAAFTCVLIVRRQDALTRLSHYNITWDASQSLAELLRLETEVAAYGVPGAGSSRDRVELRLEIVANRVGLLLDGQIDDLLVRDADLRRVVEQLARAVTRTQGLVKSLDHPGAVQAILAELIPLDAGMARLASAANALGAEEVAADQRTLGHIHWVFSALLGGLILCTAALAFRLLRHNEMHNRSQRELRSVARSLEQTGRELADASRAASDSNAELRLQNQRFDAALNNMSQGLCMADAQARVIVCNERFAELFGLHAGSIVAGLAIADMVSEAGRFSPDDRALLSDIAERQLAYGRQRRSADFFCESDEGRAVAVLQRPMQGGGWVATYEDITDRRRVEARIRHMAHHDALTNLPNRVLLRERMEVGLRAARESGDGVAVLLLDLDLFKDVNDTMGHPAGDALLEMVGRRLRNCVGAGDVVARLGGDEFAVLQAPMQLVAQTATLAQRIVDVLQAPYELDGQRIAISASIGIAMAPGDGWDPDQLMKSADMALYQAKARGRATYCFFEQDMQTDVQERRTLGLELREAMAQHDFEMYYQPVVGLASDRPSGFEALIRWRHKQRGLVLPSRFIPLAEEMGLIATLGAWTLQQACRDCASWPDDLAVAVNLSPRQFGAGNLVPIVEQALRDAGLSPTRLELEVTESVLLQDNEANIATLFALRALGIRIALDDFGTGYSSLSYLRRFPFDKIKVDRSFVQGMADDADALAIVQSIVDLAPKLGMRTTAEGIETMRELTQVRAAGCDEGQGYFFGRPMRGPDVGPYLAGRPANGAAAELARRPALHGDVRDLARAIALRA